MFIFWSAPSWHNFNDWYKNHWQDLAARAPDWEVNFFSDAHASQLIRDRCSEREKVCFSRLNPRYGPARADFLRYVLMREAGGLWLDAKSVFEGQLLENFGRYAPLPPVVFVHWGWPNQAQAIPENHRGRGEICNWVLLSQKGHPVWDVVLDAVCTRIEQYTVQMYGVGKEAVLRVTGPIAMSRCIYARLHTWPHLFLSAGELKFQFDVLGKHQKKAHMLGGGIHYSKLKEPVVLDQP